MFKRAFGPSFKSTACTVLAYNKTKDQKCAGTIRSIHIFFRDMCPNCLKISFFA